MVTNIVSDSWIYSNLDSAKNEVITMPFKATRIEICSNDLSDTGVNKISGDLSASKCMVRSNDSSNGLTETSATYLAAKIYMNPVTIAGAFTVASGELVFTPTSAANLALLSVDSYVTASVTETQTDSKASIGTAQRFVQSVSSAAANLGAAAPGSGAASIAGEIVVHPKYAGLDFTFPSNFAIQSRSGDKVTLKGNFPPITLSNSLNSTPGALRLSMHPISPAANSGIRKGALKSSVTTSIPIEAVNAGAKTIVVLDKNSILLGTGNVTADVFAQGGFASTQSINEFAGQDTEGLNSIMIGAGAVSSESNNYYAVVYADREVENA